MTCVSTPRKEDGDRFETDLRYENVPGRSFWWRLLQDLEFWSERMREWIIVPKGRVQNLTSIPRLLWSIWPPTDERYAAAASVHDELYLRQVGRKLADNVFRDGMRAIGEMSDLEMDLFYKAVRVGGWWAYWKAGKRGREMGLI